MRALLQRVKSASVRVDDHVVGSIASGWLILLGIHEDDTEQELEFVLRKCLGLRVFSDDTGKMNLDIHDTKGSALIVSQFTLYADYRKGRRPSFAEAAPPEKARALYEAFCQSVAAQGVPVETGQFGAHMDVELINDGPVTIMLDSNDMKKS